MKGDQKEAYDPGPSGVLGSGHFKCCMSEDIQVAQLAALKEGSKEAKVRSPASIWTSQPATSPPAL